MCLKLFYFIFIIILYNNYAYGLTSFRQNYLKNNYFKRYIKKFIFLKKNECFSFVKFKKKLFRQKVKIIIRNNNYIGFLEENKFSMFHIVKSKDTLYSIAKYSGHNYHELSKFNFIKKPYKIIIGQKIWVGDIFINHYEYNCLINNANNNFDQKNSSCQFFFNQGSNIINFFNKNVVRNSKLIKICFFYNKKLKEKNTFKQNKSFVFSNIWYWPIKSQRIQYFYNSYISDKKIEISGFKGQPIFAAAPGEVIFITDLFKKYGKLIIIKHSKNYLSIYAFNDTVLVNKKDRVYANQKIATMGFSSKNNLVRLYFEIRYRGKSINPLNILPKIN